MALGDFLFPHIEMKLVVARSFESDIAGTESKLSQEYIDATARVSFHKSDLQKLGLKDGKNVNLKSDAGSVIVKAFGSDKATEGIAVMPHGPWALSLVNVPSDEQPPTIHGVSITATRSDENITRPESLFLS